VNEGGWARAQSRLSRLSRLQTREEGYLNTIVKVESARGDRDQAQDSEVVDGKRRVIGDRFVVVPDGADVWGERSGAGASG
jgi:hypothetical protein